MTEAFSEERFMQLDERWRRDPSSRIFVQLAEEYRRAGRLDEAIRVLEQGLRSHPTYVSALVALGRCRLESGDPAHASEVLEQAVVHDPAQLVANKLLVEAYLRTGRADKARERLDFYRLFNQRDAEIDALERRIAEASVPPATPPAPAARPRVSADIFDLRHPSAPPLELPTPAPRPAPAPPVEPFGLLHEPFDARRRIARALSAGGLFPISVPAPAPLPVAAAAVAAAAVVATPAVPELETAVPEPEAPPWGVASRSAELELEAREEVLAAPFSPRAIGEEVERETIEEPFDEVYEVGSSATALPRSTPEAPAPIPFPVSAPPAEAAAVPAAPAAIEIEPEAEAAQSVEAAPVVEAVELPGTSATLGELFLSQGHLEEATREFRAVLAVRPGDSAALSGLEEIARRRSPVAAAAEVRTTGPGLTRRKIETLRGYLDRVRRARESSRVS